MPLEKEYPLYQKRLFLQLKKAPTVQGYVLYISTTDEKESSQC